MAFNSAVNYLAANNDVVVDDLGFLGLPYDGTSTVSRNTANALNNDQNSIRGYFTSVGNSADEHYLGTYTDSGVDGQTITGITTAGHLHLFQRTGDTTDILGLGAQPYNLISLPTNGEVAIFLTWDDGFGASSNDYNLYLVRQSNRYRGGAKYGHAERDAGSGRIHRFHQFGRSGPVQNHRPERSGSREAETAEPLFVRARMRSGRSATAGGRAPRTPQLQHGIAQCDRAE